MDFPFVKEAISQLFSKPSCAMYPAVPSEAAPNYRGRIVYHADKCIGCGKCVEVCPIGLHPLKIKIAADADRIDECKQLHVLDCTLCGSCSFICPAHRWLTASFKVAKQKLAAQAKKGGSGK